MDKINIDKMLNKNNGLLAIAGCVGDITRKVNEIVDWIDQQKKKQCKCESGNMTTVSAYPCGDADCHYYTCDNCIVIGIIKGDKYCSACGKELIWE